MKHTNQVHPSGKQEAAEHQKKQGGTQSGKDDRTQQKDRPAQQDSSKQKGSESSDWHKEKQTNK
jgi:hypothetical protein